MNTQKSVFNKISKIEKDKVELSEERVELAMIDDIKNYINELQSIFSTMDKEGDDLGRLLGDSIRKQRILEDLNDKNQSVAKNAIKAIQEIEQKAKELGVNVPKEVNTLKNLYKDSAEYNSIVRGIGKIPQL